MNSDGGPLYNGMQYCGIVPYLGIFLSDFTFLDEGSQTFSSPGLIPSPLQSFHPLMFNRCAYSTALLSLAGLVNLKKVKLFSSMIKKIKEYIVYAFCAHALADTSRAGGRQKATRYTSFLSFGIA